MSTKKIQKVDKNSPMPIYQQIVNDIIARIAQEEFAIGDKLPSENELSAEYGASRVTIRQALAKLDADGLIDKQRGRGVFLKANPHYSTQELYLPQVGTAHVSTTKSEHIKISVTTQASPQVYNGLDLAPSEPLIYLQRMFTRKHHVVGYNQAWFPLRMVPDMDKQGLVNDSITATMQQRYSIYFHSVENYIESVILDAATAQQLNTTTTAPGLKITSIYTTSDGTPIEYATTVWNGSDTRFHVMLATGNVPSAT